MRESVGYTATLNIIIIFITVIFGFIFISLSYYRAYKISNVVTDSIEKYEGYNLLSKTEIERKMILLGYTSFKIDCPDTIDSGSCGIINPSGTRKKGYCVYKCLKEEGYYYYKIRTNMLMNIPLINNIVNIPIYSSTNKLYDFEGTLGG